MTSLNTQLEDRILWYDGQSSFDPDRLVELVTKYNVRYVTRDSNAVNQYNKHVSKLQEITVKTECGSLPTDWNIPDEYKNLDMVSYVSVLHSKLVESMPPEEVNAREIRLAVELSKYRNFGLMNVLRTITWVINTLENSNVVWGVGRGSSVSSYVLYVLGVHDVDSHKYDLDVDDFLHP